MKKQLTIGTLAISFMVPSYNVLGGGRGPTTPTWSLAACRQQGSTLARLDVASTQQAIINRAQAIAAQGSQAAANQFVQDLHTCYDPSPREQKRLQNLLTQRISPIFTKAGLRLMPLDEQRLSKQVKSLISEAAALTVQNQKLTKQLRAITPADRAQAAQLQQLQDELQQSNDDLTVANDQLRRTQQALAARQIDITTAERTIADLNNRIAVLARTNDELQAELQQEIARGQAGGVPQEEITRLVQATDALFTAWDVARGLQAYDDQAFNNLRRALDLYVDAGGDRSTDLAQRAIAQVARLQSLRPAPPRPPLVDANLRTFQQDIIRGIEALRTTEVNGIAVMLPGPADFSDPGFEASVVRNPAFVGIEVATAADQTTANNRINAAAETVRNALNTYEQAVSQAGRNASAINIANRVITITDEAKAQIAVRPAGPEEEQRTQKELLADWTNLSANSRPATLKAKGEAELKDLARQIVAWITEASNVQGFPGPNLEAAKGRLQLVLKPLGVNVPNEQVTNIIHWLQTNNIDIDALRKQP